MFEKKHGKWIAGAVLCAYFAWLPSPVFADELVILAWDKAKPKAVAEEAKEQEEAEVREESKTSEEAKEAPAEEEKSTNGIENTQAKQPQMLSYVVDGKIVKRELITVSGDIEKEKENSQPWLNLNSPQSYFYLEPTEGENATRFYNRVDGYVVTIPGKVTIKNRNLSGLCAVLSADDRQIEIFREDFTNNNELQAYLTYTYKGLDQSTADRKEEKRTAQINGRWVQIYRWNRDKLSRIQDDYNYYTSLDIVEGNSVYNIYIKSSQPIEQCGGYQSILESFTTLSRSAMGGNRISEAQSGHEWNEETAAFYQKTFAADAPLTWGLFEPSAPGDLTPLKNKEAELNYTFPILLYYNHIHKSYEWYPIDGILEKAYAASRTLELTLQTNNEDEAREGNMVYQVLNGVYDDYLHKYAAAIAKFGHPVLFRLGNEMNGDWCPYSAYHTSRDTSIYRAFYRYVYEIFRQEGAIANTIWIWNPNERAYPNYKWNYEMLYYPGDAYVDVIGLTGYNNGTYYASVGEIWRTFDQIYDPIYKKVRAYSGKPLMITEFSCSSVGGDKAQWVKEMFQSLHKYPLVKVAVWWDGRDLAANGEVARPYYINDNAQAIEYFRIGFNGGTLE